MVPSRRRAIPVDDIGFNDEFNSSVTRVRDGADPMAEQARLLALIPALESAGDREWAARLVADLEQASVPRKRSELFRKALRTQADAFLGGGSDAAYLARIRLARRRIQQLSDQADDTNEAARIRALTRVLDHVDQRLHHLSWS
jgi:hypothetical protein